MSPSNLFVLWLALAGPSVVVDAQIDCPKAADIEARLADLLVDHTESGGRAAVNTSPVALSIRLFDHDGTLVEPSPAGVTTLLGRARRQWEPLRR